MKHYVCYHCRFQIRARTRPSCCPYCEKKSHEGDRKNGKMVNTGKVPDNELQLERGPAGEINQSSVSVLPPVAKERNKEQALAIQTSVC